MQSKTTSPAPRRNARPAGRDNEPPWDDDDMLRTACRDRWFWLHCPTPRCRRVHDCTGEAYDCFVGRWARGTESDRDWFRAYFAARRRGLDSIPAAQSATAIRRRIRRREQQRAALCPVLEGWV